MTIIAFLALALYLIAQAICWVLFRPPPYHILPSDLYFPILEQFVQSDLASGRLPRKSDGWLDATVQQLREGKAELERGMKTRQPLVNMREALAGARLVDSNGAGEQQVISLIPSTLFSSDRTPKPIEGWTEYWSNLKFNPVTFLNDPQADEFMKSYFGPISSSSSSRGGDESRLDASSNKDRPSELASRPWQAWKALPRGVLRADFLRYMLLLTEGGTWADMDVEPLLPLPEWIKDMHHIAPAAGEHGAGAKKEQALKARIEAQPIRIVLGLECEPVSYSSISPRGWLERARLLPVSP